VSIDLLGASVSHSSVGDGVQNIATPILFLAVAAASWALRPPSRVMGQILPSQGAQPAASSAPVT